MNMRRAIIILIPLVWMLCFLGKGISGKVNSKSRGKSKKIDPSKETDYTAGDYPTLKPTI
jgi:hypothetical protein